MASILVLNGPNLNLLGTREPDVYGAETLDSIDQRLQKQAYARGYTLTALQSNSEVVLIERVHQAYDDDTGFIIINPAALTHTSIALRDALLAVGIPFIEVHLSNIYSREAFRHHSYFSDIAQGVICGLGTQGYTMAVMSALDYLSQ